MKSQGWGPYRTGIILRRKRDIRALSVWGKGHRRTPRSWPSARDISQETNFAGTLTRFETSRFENYEKNKYLLLKPPSVWCLVMVALADSSIQPVDMEKLLTQ